MIRIALEVMLPFLLPFAAYFTFAYFANRAEAQGIRLQDMPWVWLAITGVSFVIVFFVVTGLMTGSDPSGRYVPPRLEDGRIVPGHIEQ